MRAFLLALLVALPAHAEGPFILQWEKVSELWFTPSQVRMYGPGAVNSLIIDDNPVNQVGCQTPNVWCSADLKLYGVPSDAKYAFLSGILIITHGSTAESANFTVTFKKPGTSGDCSKYIAQAIEPFTGGGQRSGAAVWVPLTNGVVDYCFLFALPRPTGWPTYSAYGVNLSVQAWAR